MTRPSPDIPSPRTLVVIGIIAALGFAGHDDARWIMESQLHSECCGPRDCEPVHASRVYRTKDGWKVAGYEGHLAPEEVRPSIGRRTWACRYLHNNQLRCLFLPVPAMVRGGAAKKVVAPLRRPARARVGAAENRRKAPTESVLRGHERALSSLAQRHFHGGIQ